VESICSASSSSAFACPISEPALIMSVKGISQRARTLAIRTRGSTPRGSACIHSRSSAVAWAMAGRAAASSLRSPAAVHSATAARTCAAFSAGNACAPTSPAESASAAITAAALRIVLLCMGPAPVDFGRCRSRPASTSRATAGPDAVKAQAVANLLFTF
jgi:hypothetical protein